MKIVHLSKSDIAGGAARAAYGLHSGLRRIGVDSSMFVASRSSDDANVAEYKKPMGVPALAQRGFRQLGIDRRFNRYRGSRPGGYELFSSELSAFGGTVLDQLPPGQVFNLHWVAQYLDYPSFFSHVPQHTPVVWTLHDLNVMTGGCHYDLGCARFTSVCGACPQLGSNDSKDLSNEIWSRKQKLFSRVNQSRLRFVTPSKWLAGELKKSPFLERFSVDVIPYGLDLEIFTPRDRGKARELLGIPQAARVLLFVAAEVDNMRKGFGILTEALTRCASQIPNLMLISLGQKRPKLKVDVPWIHLGSVDNDRFISIVYSAADLFAICSLQDNLPNTVLEAMACGIPVVGHDIGGIPDMVRNNITGRTTPVADPNALGFAIAEILNDSSRSRQMGENARKIALAEYPIELQARRYADLYRTLS